MKRKREEEFMESPMEVDKANPHDKVKENQAQQGQGIAGADRYVFFMLCVISKCTLLKPPRILYCATFTLNPV